MYTNNRQKHPFPPEILWTTDKLSFTNRNSLWAKNCPLPPEILSGQQTKISLNTWNSLQTTDKLSLITRNSLWIRQNIHYHQKNLSEQQTKCPLPLEILSEQETKCPLPTDFLWTTDKMSHTTRNSLWTTNKKFKATRNSLWTTNKNSHATRNSLNNKQDLPSHQTSRRFLCSVLKSHTSQSNLYTINNRPHATNTSLLTRNKLSPTPTPPVIHWPITKMFSTAINQKFSLTSIQAVLNHQTFSLTTPITPPEILTDHYINRPPTPHHQQILSDQ